jgi:hypothetical protein
MDSPAHPESHSVNDQSFRSIDAMQFLQSCTLAVICSAQRSVTMCLIIPTTRLVTFSDVPTPHLIAWDHDSGGSSRSVP